MSRTRVEAIVKPIGARLAGVLDAGAASTRSMTDAIVAAVAASS